MKNTIIFKNSIKKILNTDKLIIYYCSPLRNFVQHPVFFNFDFFLKKGFLQRHTCSVAVRIFANVTFNFIIELLLSILTKCVIRYELVNTFNMSWEVVCQSWFCMFVPDTTCCTQMSSKLNQNKLWKTFLTIESNVWALLNPDQTSLNLV